MGVDFNLYNNYCEYKKKHYLCPIIKQLAIAV